MYHYSLEYFLQLFQGAIKLDKDGESREAIEGSPQGFSLERKNQIESGLIGQIFTHIRQGIYG